MSELEIILRVFAGVLLVLVNAFFVAIEFSLTRLRQFSEDEVEGRKGLERAWEMTDELEIYLTGCQLGISLSSIVLGIVAEPGVTALLEPLFELLGVADSIGPAISIAVAVVIIQLAHKIWGEQTPTYLGIERPLLVARWLAPPLYWWSKVMYPFIILGDSVAKGTLRLFGVEMTRSWVDAEVDGDDAAQAGTPEFREQLTSLLAEAHIKGERREEIVNAYELGEQTARDIMVPRDQITALRIADSVSENFARLRDNGYTRLPLVGDTLEDFRGVVYVASVIADYEALRDGSTTFEQIAGPPVEVDAGIRLDEVIDKLQEECGELALVTEGGRVVGLLTATDTFEAVIGDLEDPLDASFKS